MENLLRDLGYPELEVRTYALHAASTGHDATNIDEAINWIEHWRQTVWNDDKSNITLWKPILQTVVQGCGDVKQLDDGLRILSKILSNILSQPNNQNFRSLRLESNTLQCVLRLVGGPELLTECGFHPDAAGQILILADSKLNVNALSGLLELVKAIRQQTVSILRKHAQPQRSFRGFILCSVCHHEIVDEITSDAAAGNNVWFGDESTLEYRYECTTCGASLCSACADKWKAGDSSLHPSSHDIIVKPPKTRRLLYGAPPPPPPLSRRPRRGPFG